MLCCLRVGMLDDGSLLYCGVVLLCCGGVVLSLVCSCCCSVGVVVVLFVCLYGCLFVCVLVCLLVYTCMPLLVCCCGVSLRR